ncbi:NAD(P)-binding protein [Thozetella sp. PMI_491]|nr:NAD(P)-binding protein [Thozetella sp. PMI_491]
MSGTRLQGKVAIVTGGAAGFGAAIVTRFVQDGACVLIGDIDLQGANALKAKLGADDRIVAIKMDISSPDDWKAAVDETLKTWNKLDIVVHNAGINYPPKPATEVTLAEFERLFSINVKGNFFSVQATVPVLEKFGGGSIINISSISSLRPRPNLVWYTATKGAINAVTKGLAAEVGPKNIRVNAIAPLLAAGTGLVEVGVGVPDTPENQAKFVSNVPLGRVAKTTDIANAAAFLASDDASFITGTIMEVDGGRAI